MLVCYRDDGFWILTWYRWSRLLMNGLGGTSTLHLPGWGFVGQASASFLATEVSKCKLRSTRMHRIASTDGARLWRLTCVWQLRKESRTMLSGNGSELDGSRWEDDGGATSAPARESTA